MNKQRWTAVDNYIEDLVLPRDPELEAALRSSDAAELPNINVAPNQGKFLYLLAKMKDSRRILEVGTLGGYSTIWLARALPPSGRLVTLEYEPKHAEVAAQNIAHAGLSKLVEIRVGLALDSLKKLVEEGVAPFDFIFIDADKPGYSDYFEWALMLSKKGTVIIADNVVRDGAVIDPNSDDERVHGIRRFNEHVAKSTRVTSTILQTVGSKGYDGFAMMLVTRV